MQYYSDSRQCFAEIYLSSSCDLVSYKVVIVMATNNPNNPLMTFTEYEKASDPKGAKEEKVEQHITLVQNSKARRGSFTHHAFPELHSKKAEPDTLLLLTRTRTDSRGRRHSVAVPLLPPPDGEKFAGGYQIQRNPITGGARLLPPTTAKSKRGGLSPSRLIRHSSSECNVQKNSPLSSIEEKSAVMKNVPSSTKKQNGHEAHPVAGSGTSSSSTGAIPRGRQGRRHSVQVTSLTKDMEKLKVGEGSHSNHSGTEKMSESRKKELRKLSQKRRSSKQSFLHFLDLAIAK